MTRIIGMFSGVALAAMLTTAANAAPITVACPAFHVAAATATGAGSDVASTISSSWVDVPGLAVSIDVHGFGGGDQTASSKVASGNSARWGYHPPNCVVVAFTGSVRTATGTFMFVRAVLEGGPRPQPPQIRTASTSHSAFETGSAIVVFPDVPDGTYTIKIQFRSTAGTLVEMRNRGFVAHY